MRAELILPNRVETVTVALSNGKINLQGTAVKMDIRTADIFLVTYPKKNMALVRFGNNGENKLKLEYPNIEGYLKNELGSFPEKSGFVFGTGFGIFLIIVGVILTLCVLAYVFLIPWIAVKSAEHFPKEYEISMGKELKDQYLANERIDTLKSRILNEYANQINFASDYPLEFTVVTSETVNAFALPGGQIVVYSGILKKMNRHEELVALLSHEASHVQFRHSTRSLFRQVSGVLFISFLFGDAGDVASAVAGQADQLNNLSYSRDLESEADREGFKIMQNNGFDTMGMHELLTHISSGNEGNAAPEFLSSHPLPEDRIREVKELAAKGNAGIRSHPQMDSLWVRLKN